MSPLLTWFWVSILIMLAQAIAIIILSAGWGLFFMSRSYATSASLEALKLAVDSNDKRIENLEDMLRKGH